MRQGCSLGVHGSTCRRKSCGMLNIHIMEANVKKDGWIDVNVMKPSCPRDPDALSTPVLIWPRNPDRERQGVDGHAYYGRRATGKPAFYKYGVEIHGIKYWMLMPKGPL